MSIIGGEWWREVSPYLDEALALPAAERGAWLESLRARQPALADGVEALLGEHRALEQECFLEDRGFDLPGQPAAADQKMGAYRLIAPIGAGGMGTVWLAERSDGRFDRQVAVKFLSVALARRGAARFQREGSILGSLAHPHIAELLDAGVWASGQPYLVLEYVDGEPIDQYCDRRGLDVEARVRLFLDVLAAVAHAHASLVVHRDLKPSNVLVRKDGRVKLLDFGIAKLLEEEGSPGAATELTREGGAALTPEYAAPEQICGRAVTTATDVYGLGVLLYVLLTGRHPAGQARGSAADLVKAIVEVEPQRPSDGVMPDQGEAACRGTTPEKLQRQLRGDLDTIAAKALKKDPRERYASVAAMADDLQRCLRHEPIGARPDTVRYRTAKFVRRNRVTVALALLALAAAGAGVVGTWTEARRARAQRDFALRQLSRAEAINDLNSFLLSDAAPGGKPFTVNELLERAEHIVERGREGSAANRVDLLVTIGDQYRTQDEDARALQVLTAAYGLSRQLPDPSVRARASCALAGVLAPGGELARAEALIQEGLRELPGGPPFALDRVYCLLRGSYVSREAGASQEGIARIQAGQRLLHESPLRSSLLELRLLLDLAEAYRIAGRQGDAIREFQQASERLTALGRDDTETAGTLFNNWALALSQSGRPLEAEPIFQRAIEISRAGKSQDGVSPMLMTNYARVLRDLGRLDEAAQYADDAYAKAKQVGHQVVISQSLLLRAGIYRELRQLPRSAEMLAEVAPRLRQDLPPGHYAFASLASEQSLLAQARGDLQASLGDANQAVSIVEASIRTGHQGADALPGLLIRRSGVERELGRIPEAVTDAHRGVSLLQKAVPAGSFSSNLGRAWLALGRALDAEGKREEAHAAFVPAAQHLETTLGPHHPETVAALQQAGPAAP